MQKLIDGLHKFRSEVFPARADFFGELARGQRPETLFITCSDSRINPNLLTQTEPGELFILRNAGNLVPAYSPQSSGEAATIEFAVQHLGVQHVVVCGHTQCGAMKALLAPGVLSDSPAVATWLQHAEATRRHVADNYKHLTGEALATVLVEENVLSQLENLRTHPAIRARLARSELTLHGWVYRMDSTEVFQFDTEEGQFVRIDREARTRGVVRPMRALVGI
ncbi:MAG: carbonic anhydrase [Polyangiaceae bacterium]